MKKYILFSGTIKKGIKKLYTYKIFSKNIENLIKQECKNVQNIAVIQAYFNNEELSLKKLKKYKNTFKKAGLKIKTFNVLLKNMKQEECKKLIDAADMVFLAGGFPEQQMQFINEKNLLPSLNKKEIIIGGSAGAMNLGQKSLCVTDPDYENLQIFEALNFAPINIVPHYRFQNTQPETLKDFYKVSKEYDNVFFMADDTAVMFKENNFYIAGDNLYISKSNKIEKYMPKNEFKYY